MHSHFLFRFSLVGSLHFPVHQIALKKDPCHYLAQKQLQVPTPLHLYLSIALAPDSLSIPLLSNNWPLYFHFALGWLQMPYALYYRQQGYLPDNEQEEIPCEFYFPLL